MKYALCLLFIALGGFAVVAGEADDSPGLSGIGLLTAIAAVVVMVRIKNRRRGSRIA
ncbi:MAG: hypothetical protein ACT4QF_03045 [Sporichthyaceae bacterium]